MECTEHIVNYYQPELSNVGGKELWQKIVDKLLSTELMYYCEEVRCKRMAQWLVESLNQMIMWLAMEMLLNCVLQKWTW